MIFHSKLLVYQRVTDRSLFFIFFSAGCSCFMMFLGGFQALKKQKKRLFHSCLAPTLQYVELRFICLYSTLGYLWICSWGTCWYKEIVIHGDQHLWKHPSLRMDPSFRLASPRRPQAAGVSFACQARRVLERPAMGRNLGLRWDWEFQPGGTMKIW